MNVQWELLQRIRRAVIIFAQSDTAYWSPEDEDNSSDLDEATKPILHLAAYGTRDGTTVPVTCDWIVGTFHNAARDRDIERSNTFKKSLFLLTLADQHEKDRYIDWLADQEITTSLSYVPQAIAESFMWGQPTILHDGKDSDKAQQNIEKVVNWLINNKGKLQEEGLDTDAEYGLSTLYAQCLTGAAQRDKKLAYNAALSFPCMISRPDQLEELCAHSSKLKKAVIDDFIPEFISHSRALPHDGYLAKSQLFNSMIETTDLIEHFTVEQKEVFFSSLIKMHGENFNDSLNRDPVCIDIVNAIEKAPCSPFVSGQIVSRLLLAKDNYGEKRDFGYINECGKGVMKHYSTSPSIFKGYIDTALTSAFCSSDRNYSKFLKSAIEYAVETDGASALLVDALKESKTLSLPDVTAKFNARGGVYEKVANQLNMAAIENLDTASESLLEKVKPIVSKPAEANSLQIDHQMEAGSRTL